MDGWREGGDMNTQLLRNCNSNSCRNITCVNNRYIFIYIHHYLSPFLLWRVVGDLEPVLADHGQEAWHTLDKLPVHHRADIQYRDKKNKNHT